MVECSSSCSISFTGKTHFSRVKVAHSTNNSKKRTFWWKHCCSFLKLQLTLFLYKFILIIQLHTFWVEIDNYYSVTKPWFASRIPFPLSWYLPGKMSRDALNRILLTKGQPPLYSLTEVEAQVCFLM